MTPLPDGAPVLELINPSAVSRILRRAGLQRDETIGAQTRPYEPLPRTGGYHVRQDGPPWYVEVIVYRADRTARTAEYQQITTALAAARYELAPTAQPRAHSLTVSRRRPPTPAEWAALEDLAQRPRIAAPEAVHAAPRAGLDGIPPDVFAALRRSDLAAIVATVPIMRTPDSDDRRDRGSVIGLTDAGTDLLIARNKARSVRAMWGLIAPENRWPKERPALLDGDPGREAIAAARRVAS